MFWQFVAHFPEKCTVFDVIFKLQQFNVIPQVCKNVCKIVFVVSIANSKGQGPFVGSSGIRRSSV